MKAKKNPEADLEKAKSVFFLTGLLIALGLVFAAFNISSEKTSVIECNYGRDEIIFEDPEIQPTRPEVDKIKPPLPKPVVEALQVVDNDEDVTDDPILIIQKHIKILKLIL